MGSQNLADPTDPVKAARGNCSFNVCPVAEFYCMVNSAGNNDQLQPQCSGYLKFEEVRILNRTDKKIKTEAL